MKDIIKILIEDCRQIKFTCLVHGERTIDNLPSSESVDTFTSFHVTYSRPAVSHTMVSIDHNEKHPPKHDRRKSVTTTIHFRRALILFHPPTFSFFAFPDKPEFLSRQVRIHWKDFGFEIRSKRVLPEHHLVVCFVYLADCLRAPKMGYLTHELLSATDPSCVAFALSMISSDWDRAFSWAIR